MTGPALRAQTFIMRLLAADIRVPRRIRRAVLLTFPVSYPVLYVAFILLCPLLILEAFILGAAGLAKDMWQ